MICLLVVVIYIIVVVAGRAATASVWPRRPTFCAIELKCDDTDDGMRGVKCLCVCKWCAYVPYIQNGCRCCFSLFSYNIPSCCCCSPRIVRLEAWDKHAAQTNGFVAMQPLNAAASHVSCICVWSSLCVSVCFGLSVVSFISRFIYSTCNNFIWLL